MQSSTDPLLQWLSNAGALGILAAACVAFLKGWIVPRGTYERALAEKDRAMELVYKQADVAQKALDHAERKP